jgi:hypothetical protein
VPAVPLALTLKIEPNGARGTDSQYTFTTQFSQTLQPRRRGARH